MVSSQLPPAPVIYLVEPFGGSVRRQNPNMPHVFWDDAAVTRGDGVFESILVRGGTPVNLDKHLDRFARSAKLLGLPDPGREHWTRATEEAVADYCRERGDDNEGDEHPHHLGHPRLRVLPLLLRQLLILLAQLLRVGHGA